MKSYLFSLLLIFPFAFSFGQTETNNRNNNTNTIPLEKKAKLLKKKEQRSEPMNVPVESEAVEELSPASPVPVMTDAVDKDATLQIDSQRASYLNNYFSLSQQSNQRSLTAEQAETMDDLLRNLASVHPESFESYLFYYLNGQNDLNRSKALLKANALKPEDEMVQKEMMTYYVLMNKKDETRKAVLNLSQNKVYDESTNSYGLDMINSTPQNGTLITHGKEDSYAALFAQNVKREREDVEILSLDWLTSPQYREILKSKGWLLPAGEFVDTKYLEELCKLNKAKNIAISMTLPKDYLLPLLDKLYVSGLVFEYRDVPTDMTARNEELWDLELNKELIKSSDNNLVNNYLPMLFQLKRVYEAKGDSESVKKIDTIIQEIKSR